VTLSERLRQAAAASNASKRDEIEEALAGVQRDDRLFEAVVEGINEDLIRVLGPQMYSGTINTEALEGEIFVAVQRYLQKAQIPLSQVERAHLVQDVLDHLLRHGPIESLLRDPTVSEVMVTRFDTIYIERNGVITKSPFSFSSEAELRRTIDRIVARVGRRIDESSPMVDARLPDGSRVNAVIPPIAIDGANLTIRKFPAERMTMEELIALSSLTREAAEFLQQCVRNRLSMLVSGGTGSGKTTLLNVLSAFIPATERIITIEDSAELQLDQPHVVRMEARPANAEGHGQVTIRELVRNSLRMRPDRIIVGEVRDAAALDMLQAMNTGHEGSLTTVHANSAVDALSRIETMVLMAGMDLPVAVIREQTARAIDLIVHQERMPSGKRHVVEIAQVSSEVDGRIEVTNLFEFTDGVLQRTDVEPSRRVKRALQNFRLTAP
jgi:pilus assembly protein CpaF